MCRNIVPLFNFDPPATDEEIHAAALQFVRKVSGFRQPSQANQAAFDRAVQEIAGVVRELMAELVTSQPPRDREVVAAQARARAATRYTRGGD
ncbi:MAG: DUF2277 domain-containing protein [Caldilineaceae bacterium]|jgi:hypothetical protein|nr:DUF2277 domain-containing protein [Caldilineaceae bacterium]